MTEPATFGAEGRTLTVRVPMTLRKRGGRKVVQAPAGTASGQLRPSSVDSAMVKALAKAFRWRNLLETGVHGTVAEVAAAERINPSYVSRVVRLTLLAPEIIEAILDGRRPADMTLVVLMESFPIQWPRQVHR